MSGAPVTAPPVYRITLVQIAVLLPVVALAATVDRTVALSLLSGGLIAVVPQAWFARRLFRRRGAGAAQRAARDGYAAEVGKFALSAAGFAAVFITLRPISGGAVFSGFGLMLVLQIVGSAWLLRQPRVNNPENKEHD